MKDLKFTTGVAAALLAAPLATGCNQQQDNGWTADRDTAVCVDKEGHRVPDSQCPQQRQAVASSFGSPFLWYYLGRQSSLPYYGDTVRGGSYAPTAGHSYFRAPAGTAMTRSASSRGGSIARGGFGSSARGFGGAGE